MLKIVNGETVLLHPFLSIEDGTQAATPFLCQKGLFRMEYHLLKKTLNNYKPRFSSLIISILCQILI